MGAWRVRSGANIIVLGELALAGELCVIPQHTFGMRNQWPFESVVRDVVRLLAAGDYVELERRSAGVRLTAGELAGAVAEYPYRPVVPPSGSAPPLDVVPIIVAKSPAWSVSVPLWTAEEGRSDLTLQLTVYAESPVGYRVEIDNLLVP